MNYLAITGLSILIMNIFMVIIVICVRARKIQILWALTALCIAFFGLGFYLMAVSQTAAEGLIGWKIGYIGVISIPALMLHTVLSITKDTSKRHIIILILSYIVALWLNIINLQQGVISDVVVLFHGSGYYIPLGYTFSHFYYGAFMLYFKLTVIYLLYVLYISYKRTSIYENKRQYLFFGLGVGIGFIGGESCFAPTYGLNIYPYFGILIGIYPTIILYSILRHHLFDARSAILQILRIVFIIVLSTFFGVFLWYLSTRFFGYTPNISPIESVLGMSILAVGFFLNRSRKISDFFLLASLAELERETEKFLDKKGVYKSAVTLLSDLEEIFWNAMKIRKIEILGSDQTIRYPKCQHYFKNYRRPLVLSELEVEDVEGETRDLLLEVRKIGETIFSIDHGKKEGSHFLVLGKKESEHDMTQEELKIINRIIPKIALALQVLDFNSSLQEEVRIQTKTLNAKNRELEVAYQKLQDLDQNKDNFLAIASHELRTPMTIIKGYSDLFLNNTFGSLSSEARSYMQKIFDNTESLIELVNNILDISKIEAGRFEILWEEVNINDIIQKCVENFEILYRDKGITLILTNECTLDTIVTDRSKFILICNNLLSNAYKFTETNGKVEFHAFLEAECLFIKITDTGKGIEKEKLDHIFEKFNQMDNTNYTKKSIHGTGLGLHLCREIIRLLDGGIRVESTVGVGSAFIFFIPIHHDHQSAA